MDNNDTFVNFVLSCGKAACGSKNVFIKLAIKHDINNMTNSMELWLSLIFSRVNGNFDLVYMISATKKQSSRVLKRVLKNLAKFTGNHPYWSQYSLQNF